MKYRTRTCYNLSAIGLSIKPGGSASKIDAGA